jgi:hypothetical protein
MRVILPLLITVAAAGSLSAQTVVPRDQCLGGRLLSTQEGSITLQFNQRVTTIPIAPGGEIWRHGSDVESIRQLVPGDNVYLKCAQPEPSGAVIATIVAVPEGDDGLKLEPHHITAIGACVGKLIAVARDSITVRNEGTCKVQINSQTSFWRGENLPHETSLRLGDEVSVRYAVGYPGRVLTVESVEANVAKCEGTIGDARRGVIIVENFRPRESFKVYFDPRTRILDPENDNEHDFAKLTKKTVVLVVGLGLGHNSIRATSIFIEK